MCIVKTPKVKSSTTADKPKEPTVIRNPYLDGLDPATKALRRGRSSLRIERAGGAASGLPPVTAKPVPQPGPMIPHLTPTLPRITRTGVGGGGGGGRGGLRNVNHL